MTNELTPRETEILTLIAHGLDTKQIAARLFITRRTVHRHMTLLYPKINAHSRVQAAIYAMRVGLVNLDEVTL